MVRNIVKIYLDDIKRIFTNYAALIVILALCILPSLYAWFNIKASWDPYGQEATSQIKIGVVNNDQGADLNGKHVNIGNQVIDELKTNDLMGWQFVSQEEADTALEEGTYYATITLPENFSSNITSLVTSDVKKGEIIYKVNEKINAIAPKLTSKGATGVQENINKTIIETVSGILLETGESIGVEVQEMVLPKLANVTGQLWEVTSKFDQINSTVHLAMEGGVKLKDLVASIQSDLPVIQETLTSAQTLTENLEKFIQSSQSNMTELLPTIKTDIELVNSISTEMIQYVDAITAAIQSGSAEAPAMIENLMTKVESGKGLVDSLVSVLEPFAKLPIGGKLKPIIEQLQGVSEELSKVSGFLQTTHDAVANSKEPDLSLLTNIRTILTNIQGLFAHLAGNFDSEIGTSITTILTNASETAQGILTILKEAESKLPEVSDFLNIAFEASGSGIEGIEYVRNKLPDAERVITELATKMEEINENQDLKQVLELLQSSIMERQSFITNPVDLVEEPIFPMHNYGTAMTPFYSVLALWVGMTLLVSMLSVHAHGDYRPIEVYFGKYLLFGTIGLIQALIIALGDLYLLKIYCINPGLFVIGLLFTSAVFAFIVYSLVSVFGNVGKVISIILLVLQVAGSGGTFPIQLTPKFFQVIYPFLPFTYAISFAREAIGGVVESVLTHDIFVLMFYISMAILISIFLKRPINKLMSGFSQRYKESGLGE